MKKTAIILGGTKGIGASIASIFVREGMNIIIGARHDNGFAKKLGPQATFCKVDVRKESDHEKVAKLALTKTGRLDVYINGAGYSRWRPITKVNENYWNEMVDTNLKGTFWGCKMAAKYMKKGGSIINISSLAGKRGSSNNSVYCASKFGVTGLTQALAKELGGRQIRVNAVCPVYVTSDGLLKALQEEYSPVQGGDVKKYLREFAKDQAALKRLPQAEEIGRVCLFLACDSSSAITGQSINVDCGVLPQ